MKKTEKKFFECVQNDAYRIITEKISNSFAQKSPTAKKHSNLILKTMGNGPRPHWREENQRKLFPILQFCREIERKYNLCGFKIRIAAAIIFFLTFFTEHAKVMIPLEYMSISVKRKAKWRK